MMDCNWLIGMVNKDRAALILLGVSAQTVDVMNHKEIIAELKARNYKWKKNSGAYGDN